jgi:type I restriction enzyme S subunit
MQKILSREIRFKNEEGILYGEWLKTKLSDILEYEQPTRYLVSSKNYSDEYKTPVLTAGKTFLLGYTAEESGIYENLPVIIFDDFTTSFQFVDFPFKVKSSAMKMLKNKNSKDSLRFIYEAMKLINFPRGSEHKRYWISEYSKCNIALPTSEEQHKIIEISSLLDKKLEMIKAQIDLTGQYKQGLLQQMFI